MPRPLYTLVSGGAVGSDTAWFEAARTDRARSVCFALLLATFDGHRRSTRAPDPDRQRKLRDGDTRRLAPLLAGAAAALRKAPIDTWRNPYVQKLVRRDALMVELSDATLAIVNRAPRNLEVSDRVDIEGGTGWHCQMAVLQDRDRPLIVFSQDANQWYAATVHAPPDRNVTWRCLGQDAATVVRELGESDTLACVGTRELRATGRVAIERLMSALSATV